MRVRILYKIRAYPEHEIGKVYDLEPAVAREYLDQRYGEIVRGPAVETAVAPAAPERAVEREPPPDWPLKTKTPTEYIAEHGDTPEDELSPSVAANLEIARRIVGE